MAILGRTRETFRQTFSEAGRSTKAGFEPPQPGPIAKAGIWVASAGGRAANFTADKTGNFVAERNQSWVKSHPRIMAGVATAVGFVVIKGLYDGFKARRAAKQALANAQNEALMNIAAAEPNYPVQTSEAVAMDNARAAAMLANPPAYIRPVNEAELAGMTSRGHEDFAQSIQAERQAAAGFVQRN